jgi:hypothetical protein
MGGHHLRGPLARYVFRAYDDWTVIAGSLRLAAATGKPAELIARMLLDDKRRSRHHRYARSLAWSRRAMQSS